MSRHWMRYRLGMALLGAAAALSGCAETQLLSQAAKRVGGEPAAAPGGYKIGKPYEVAGVWYYPAEDWSYDETGIASWYGPGFHGKATANGETYDQNALTAAHKTLPLPSYVQVTNLENGRSIQVKVNDRGPFVNGRIIDLSRRSAQLLGVDGPGTAKVRVQILADKSLEAKRLLTGGAMVAKGETPITVDKLPKASVAAEELAPPPGGKAKPGQGGTEVAGRAPPPAASGGAKPAAPPPAFVPAPDAKVVQKQVPLSSNIYIQVGAFSRHDNAVRAQANLAHAGPIKVTSVTAANGTEMFRVRVGPLASVNNADETLERIIRSGFPDARITID